MEHTHCNHRVTVEYGYTAKQINLSLSVDEAILVRDAIIEMKQLLKNAPSERGQKLYKQATAIADELQSKIR